MQNVLIDVHGDVRLGDLGFARFCERRERYFSALILNFEIRRVSLRQAEVVCLP